ncbi:MAG: hypothetical protein ACK56F_13340 [bacterium]
MKRSSRSTAICSASSASARGSRTRGWDGASRLAAPEIAPSTTCSVIRPIAPRARLSTRRSQARLISLIDFSVGDSDCSFSPRMRSCSAAIAMP